MEIYLAYYGMEQEEFLLDEEAFIAQGMVNCINMCIPYGHWSNQNKLPYLQICKSIAEYLQWEAYDLQPGKDVREVYVIDGV